LLLVYRGLLEIGAGSTESLRIMAALVAALVVLATMVLTARICGTIEAIAAGLLLATFAASPFIESFTLSGELLAALPAVLSMLAFTGYLRDRSVVWLLLAGLLTGCAVMVKQSAFDAGLAAVLFLLVTERRRGLGKAGLVVAAAFVPVVAGIATAPSARDWWEAVVAYRADGDSLLTGSIVHRLGLFVHSVPEFVFGLGLLALLAAIGWRSAPLLARLWLGAALVGVVGGGNFHPHYYIQLATPLAVLAAVGAHRLFAERLPVARAVCSAVAVASIALTAPLWFASDTTQGRVIWRGDPHVLRADALASYVRAHTQPSDRVYVLWAAAEVYYLANRRPVSPYMWYRNVEAIDGAVASARRALAQRRPALVLVVQPPYTLDPSGKTGRILRRDYRLVARIAGTTILAPSHTA
jgi:4-amino-4-deoxy-L-arabinose transferase-like glycosyltransferase